MSKVNECRICNETKLTVILNLGEMELTGVFPSTRDQKITSGVVDLVKCSNCGLVQMGHNYPLNEMYGDNYGYRSGLNASMVKHLKDSVENILKIVSLTKNDLVLDIGSNDGTLLGHYPQTDITVVGMDPTIKKFGEYYKPHIIKIPDFFFGKTFSEHFPGRKAKIITSFSMFYDLEKPMDFVNEINSILDDNGVWIFEQSYLPRMIEQLSFDTICHEHLEYYALEQIKYMTDKAGLKIIDVTFNDVNGGSFVVFAAKKTAHYLEASEKVQNIINEEHKKGYHQLEVYKAFSDKVKIFKTELIDLLKSLKSQNKTVVALGASTKGNVLLQYCDLDHNLISAVGEVNPFKFKKFTPKTLIPIVSESEISQMNVDYKMVLPWHFRETFLKREATFLKEGGQIIFPLPKIEIIKA